MNIRDIARLANVTPGTVSKVLNNYPEISETTRQAVLKIIEETKYTPNPNARMLKLSTKPPLIGLIHEGVFDYVSDLVEESLSSRLRNSDFTIMSYHDNYYVQNKVEKFQEVINYINEHSLNGLIYMGGNFEEVPSSMFSQLSCPVVFFNTVLPEQYVQTSYSSVQVNHYDIAYKQMSYLMKKGHKKIAMLITSKDDTSVYGVRYQAYQAALRDHSLSDCLDYVIEGRYTANITYQNLRKALKLYPEITAICCSADVSSIAAIRAITDSGKKVGKEIEFISFDGIDDIYYTIPSITTFEQPKNELVHCIYDLLLGLISKEREHQHILFSARLIENESTNGTLSL